MPKRIPRLTTGVFSFFEFAHDFAVIFGIIIFAVERTDTQQYRSGHNEHDWKSCVRQKRTESSNLSCCARAKSLGITGKTSDTKAFLCFLRLLLLPVTTSYNQLHEHSREHSYAPRYMSCRRLTSAALSICFSCR